MHSLWALENRKKGGWESKYSRRRVNTTTGTTRRGHTFLGWVEHWNEGTFPTLIAVVSARVSIVIQHIYCCTLSAEIEGLTGFNVVRYHDFWGNLGVKIKAAWTWNLRLPEHDFQGSLGRFQGDWQLRNRDCQICQKKRRNWEAGHGF